MFWLCLQQLAKVMQDMGQDDEHSKYSGTKMSTYWGSSPDGVGLLISACCDLRVGSAMQFYIYNNLMH